MSVLELLKQVHLFKGLSFKEVNKVGNMFENLPMKNGDVILKEGDIGPGLFIIMSGNVGVFKSDGSGNCEISELTPGDHFGEISLLESTVTTASIIAKKEGELLKVDGNEFMDFMDDNPVIANKIYKQLLKILSRRLKKLNEEFISCMSLEMDI